MSPHFEHKRLSLRALRPRRLISSAFFRMNDDDQPSGEIAAVWLNRKLPTACAFPDDLGAGRDAT